MVGNAKVKCCVSQVPQTPPKVAKESCITVRYNGRRKIMTVDIIEEELRHMEGIRCMLAGYEVHYLTKVVYHHKDGNEASLGPRDAQKEVHANACPWGIRNGKRQERSALVAEPLAT